KWSWIKRYIPLTSHRYQKYKKGKWHNTLYFYFHVITSSFHLLILLFRSNLDFVSDFFHSTIFHPTVLDTSSPCPHPIPWLCLVNSLSGRHFDRFPIPALQVVGIVCPVLA